MRTKKSIIMLYVTLLFSTLLACISFLSQTSELPEQDTYPDSETYSAEVSPTETSITAIENRPESYALPEDFITYQDYLDVINGRASRPDTGVIEGTVIAVNDGEICPYQEEQCSITAYPNDRGLVRVDRIVEYTDYDNRPPNPVEEADDSQTTEQGVVSSEQNVGQEIVSERKAVPEITEGQEFESLFLLTANPVKVRYVPYSAENLNNNEAQREMSVDKTKTTTIERSNQPIEKTYNSIPTDDDMFVFTTQVGDFPNLVEKILPGLIEGDKFRANFKYTGNLLLIEEYELME